jgi:hypothetical protein
MSKTEKLWVVVLVVAACTLLFVGVYTRLDETPANDVVEENAR